MKSKQAVAAAARPEGASKTVANGTGKISPLRGNRRSFCTKSAQQQCTGNPSVSLTADSSPYTGEPRGCVRVVGCDCLPCVRGGGSDTSFPTRWGCFFGGAFWAAHQHCADTVFAGGPTGGRVKNRHRRNRQDKPLAVAGSSHEVKASSCCGGPTGGCGGNRYIQNGLQCCCGLCRDLKTPHPSADGRHLPLKGKAFAPDNSAPYSRGAKRNGFLHCPDTGRRQYMYKYNFNSPPEKRWSRRRAP